MEDVKTAVVHHPSPVGFPFFSRLPAEIKVRVFNLAALAPRIIHVQWERLYPENYIGSGIPYEEIAWVDKFTSRDPVPAVLQTCHLARQLSQDVYTKAFRPRRNPDSAEAIPVCDESRYLWVNFEVDKFRMSYYTLRDTLAAEKAQIRELVLEADYIGEEFMADYTELFTGMKSLKTLDVVTELELRKWAGELDALWGIFEDLFASEEGWKHSEINIIEAKTGDTMGYLNEERWLKKFAADRYEKLVLSRQDRNNAAREHVSHRERFATFRESSGRGRIEDDRLTWRKSL